jgi:hypothetical protein
MSNILTAAGWSKVPDMVKVPFTSIRILQNRKGFAFEFVDKEGIVVGRNEIGYLLDGDTLQIDGIEAYILVNLHKEL